MRVSLLIGCFSGLCVAVCVARGECLQNICFGITDAVPLASCVILSRTFNRCDLFACKVGVTRITKTEPQSQHSPGGSDCCVAENGFEDCLSCLQLPCAEVIYWDCRPVLFLCVVGIKLRAPCMLGQRSANGWIPDQSTYDNQFSPGCSL